MHKDPFHSDIQPIWCTTLKLLLDFGLSFFYKSSSNKINGNFSDYFPTIICKKTFVDLIGGTCYHRSQADIGFVKIIKIKKLGKNPISN